MIGLNTILILIFIFFSTVGAYLILKSIKEKKEAELEAKKRQEERDNKFKRINNTLDLLEPFIKSFKGITSHAEIQFYASRDIFGENGIDDKCVNIVYNYKKYSGSFILYFTDMDTMKREINNHFLDTIRNYDIFENNKIHLENVKSESIDIDETPIYTETITGKVIYKEGTNIKEIKEYILSIFDDVTEFEFYKEKKNINKFYIDGFNERKFKIEKVIF